MDKLIDIGKKFDHRILKNISFTNNSNKKLKLSDIIVLYNDSRNWKIIPLNIFMMYPLIHDTYYEAQKDSNTNIISIITIYICPYTLFSAVYFNEFIPNDQVYNNNLTLLDANDNDILFIPIKNEVYSITSQKINNKYIRRNELKIMTLRNAISMYPDAMFIDLKQIDMIDQIVSNDYMTNNIINFKSFVFSNEYDPKTLIYIIEYKSKKIDEYKYSVIIPKINTFDIVKNGFNTYFNNMVEQIRNKGGIIYTCYWFAWSGTNNKNTYKIIKL